MDLLGLDGREHVAFVGAGGKSTLMVRVGRELADSRRPVVITTTTRMGISEIPRWATECRTLLQVQAALASLAPVFLIDSVDGAKVIGISPGLAEQTFALTSATVLVEADGSQGRQFKAPGAGEPVIPANVSLVVVVAGLDALGGRIGDVCHRPERVAALTGRSVGDVLRPQDMAAVLDHSGGGRKCVPEGAKLTIVLTKVDPLHSAAVALIRSSVRGQVVTVSWRVPG